MKRIFLASLIAGLFTFGISYAADHKAMHEKMTEMGGPKPDDRIELKLPDTMKVMQKRMMRQHLDTVGKITLAIANNDLSKAAAVAKGLGWSPEEEARCSMVSDLTGEKDFLSLGMAVHKSADELAQAAVAGDRDLALINLSKLVKNCNACHEKFRH